MHFLLFGHGAFGQALKHIIEQNNHHVTIFSLGTPPQEWPENWIITLPSHALFSVFSHLNTPQRPHHVLMGSKGICGQKNIFLSPLLQEFYPDALISVLSGPNFAHEIKNDLPWSTTIASNPIESAQFWGHILKSPLFFPTITHDIMGVQIGGVMKNIIAIACGFVIGAGLGENARAMIFTQGFNEMIKLGHHFGASLDTFLGPAGIGDFALSCMNLTSRNAAFGYALAQKKDHHLLDHVTTIEGKESLRSLHHMARHQKIDLPLCTAMYELVYEKKSVHDTISLLLRNNES